MSDYQVHYPHKLDQFDLSIINLRVRIAICKGYSERLVATISSEMPDVKTGLFSKGQSAVELEHTNLKMTEAEITRWVILQLQQYLTHELEEQLYKCGVGEDPHKE